MEVNLSVGNVLRSNGANESLSGLPNFDYFSLKYLILWQNVERPIQRAMSGNPAPAELRRAMHSFRIARSFAGIADETKAMSVIQALKGVGKSGATSVEELASIFEKKFDHRNVSAASKLLWMRHRTPFLIYDRNARVALGQLAGTRADVDYAGFESAWRAEYSKSALRVAEASGRLLQLDRYFSHLDEGLDELVNQTWFHERVFDNYLWDMGGRLISAKVGSRRNASPDFTGS